MRRSEGEVMGGAPVGQVQIVGLGWPLGRNRVDLFHRRADPLFLPQLANGQLCAEGEEGSETEPWGVQQGGLCRRVRSWGRERRGRQPRDEGQRPPKLRGPCTSTKAPHPPPHALTTTSDLRTARAICLSEKPRRLACCSRSGGRGRPRCCSSSCVCATIRFIPCRNQRSMRVSSYSRSTE